jgi:hypothetical protein
MLQIGPCLQFAVRGWHGTLVRVPPAKSTPQGNLHLGLLVVPVVLRARHNPPCNLKPQWSVVPRAQCKSPVTTSSGLALSRLPLLHS